MTAQNNNISFAGQNQWAMLGAAIIVTVAFIYWGPGENTLLKLDAEDCVNLSNSYFKTGYFEKSIKASQLAISIKPDYGLAYQSLAIAYARLERWDEAIAAVEKFLILSPNDEVAKNTLALFIQEKSKLADQVKF